MLQVFGIKLVGVTPENGRKLLLSVILILFLFLLSKSLSWLAGKIFTRRDSVRVTFWSQQAIHIFTAAVLILGLVSIWFEDPTKLTTAAGMVTAGIAFALQRVITAFAGYFVILRGKTFNVGDRIVMAGVRGDVIDLGFMQTTVMEMGQPPPVQSAPPAVWVRGRQYTGRIVTITNDKIFDEPVYNYSRDFPYLWEEMTLPVSYQSDRKRAEEILLEVARKHTVKINELGEEAIQNLEHRYFMRRSELGPRVFFHLTDNWLEMSLRFLAQDAGVRELKDAMSRDIIDQLDQAGIGVASGTYEIVGLPPVRVVMDGNKQDGKFTQPERPTRGSAADEGVRPTQ